MFTFAGVRVNANDVSPKDAFFRLDTRGQKDISSSEPELMSEVIRCKKSINLHIKMWVEGFEDMMEGIDYYSPPPWVEISFGFSSKESSIATDCKTVRDSLAIRFFRVLLDLGLTSCKRSRPMTSLDHDYSKTKCT